MLNVISSEMDLVNYNLSQKILDRMKQQFE